jgi:hypothetical protein
MVIIAKKTGDTGGAARYEREFQRACGNSALKKGKSRGRTKKT